MMPTDANTIGLIIMLSLIGLPLFILAILMEAHTHRRKAMRSDAPITGESLRALTARVERERRLDPDKQSF